MVNYLKESDRVKKKQKDKLQRVKGNSGEFYRSIKEIKNGKKAK